MDCLGMCFVCDTDESNRGIFRKAFHLELVGPTMSILVANIGGVYSGIGSALAARSAGYFVANVLGVFLQNVVKQHSDALLASAFILPAIGEISFFSEVSICSCFFLFQRFLRHHL